MNWKQTTAAAVCLAALTAAAGPAPADETKGTNPMVWLKTSEGDLRVELFADRAPETVRNFLEYVDSGFYDGTLFHRVVEGFVIQGGGFTAEMEQKPTRPPVRNEADNGLKNLRGTLAMARTPVVDSATSQFFINLKDNAFLDHRDRTPAGFGYCVFGRVVEGLEVVERIGKKPVGRRGGHENVPQEPVTLLQAKRAGDGDESPPAE